eukprot:Skav224819  [mRNA]  locus=scaffold613:5807:6922:+ [translate_table: standard]
MQPLPLAVVAQIFLPRSHGVLVPESTGDFDRAHRRQDVILVAGRVVKQQTRARRDVLLEDFDSWLVQFAKITLRELLDSGSLEPERVSDLLVAYGKQLYYAGKPYGRFSETINAVAWRKPNLRRNLVAAWDLAFCWVTDEPHTHHPAMPLVVVLAVSCLALLWGWPNEAAIFLLTWCGLLRVGEVLNALRSDLILPTDSAPGVHHVYLQIRQPKTRGSAARHQSARVDPQDVIRLLIAVFGRKPRHEKLWLGSGSTLRKRFGSLLRALGLPTEASGGVRPFELASLRPGGATFLLQRFEDAEFVRRRGRWLSSRVMEVYLQEIAVATFDSKISSEACDRVNRVAASFPAILNKAIFMLDTAIPSISWPKLW